MNRNNKYNRVIKKTNPLHLFLINCVTILLLLLVFVSSNLYSAVVSNVQSGTLTSSGNGVITASITSVDLSKSFLVFSTRHNSNRPPGSMIRGRIASSTSVEFRRVTNESSSMTIQWYVVEFSSGVNVQRGEVNQSGTTINVPITSVTAIDQAFVTWSKTPRASDGSWSADDPILGELTSTGNLQFRVNGGNSDHVISWQVIEFTDPSDINVQKGSITNMTGSTKSVTATLNPAVDVNTTFVLVGYRTSGSGSDIGRRMLRARLKNSTTIKIDRDKSGSGDDITEIVWQVIELKDGSGVQSGDTKIEDGDNQKTVSISNVDVNHSVAFASVQPVGGQNMGRSSYTDDDIIGVGSVTMALSNSQIVLERQNTADKTDVGWFVVEFNAAGSGQTFSDVSSPSGTNNSNHAQGVGWADYNNDGYWDLYIAGAGKLYRNIGDGTFASPINLSGSRQVIWGDYDNDGDMDLKITGRLYRNNGDGTFSGDIDGSIGITGPANEEGQAWIDYNNDGLLDLFIPDGNNGNFMFKNNGDGTFSSQGSNALGLTPSGNGDYLAVGDYNGDGYIDIQYRINSNNTPLWKNNGNGTFTESSSSAGISFTAGNSYKSGMAFGDYDNDGDLDIYIGVYGSANKLFRNNGNGSFTNVAGSANVTAGNAYTRGVAWGDYNNDGYLDIYVGNNNSANNLFRNNGNGTFTDVASSLGINDGSKSHGITFVDYDNDGDMDIYVGNDSQANKLYRNNLDNNNYLKVKITGLGVGNSPKDGTGSRVELWNSTGDTRYAIREVNGSEGFGSQSPNLIHFGLANDWGGGSGTYQVKVKFSSGTEVLVSNVVPTSESITIGSTTLSQTIQVLEQGTVIVPFTDITSSAGFNSITGTYAVSWGDYDNNGYPDLWVGDDDKLFKNNGDGTFSAGPTLNAGGRAGHWGDYDNDGDLDFFATLNPYLHRNNGDGTFTIQNNASVGLSGPTNLGDIGWIDYNDDGYLDIWAPDGNTGNHMFKNNGDGTFTDQGSNALGLSPGSNGETTVVTDYDGDGNTDILYRSSNFVFWHSNGNGTFTNVTSPAGVSLSGDYRGTAFGDYDNDGDLDIYGGQSGSNRLYRNNGDGTFTNATATTGVAGASVTTRGVAWGDFDNDGDLDLFAANSDGTNNLFQNNSDGTFTDVATIYGLADGSSSYGATWADFDLDGDLDLFVANNSGASKMYRNNRYDNNYLKVKVKGLGAGHSPLDGIGSRVELWNSTGTTLYAVREVSGGEGYGSQAPHIVYFGLASAWGGGPGTYKIKVKFTSGSQVVVDNVTPASVSITIGGTTVNQTIEVTEQAADNLWIVDVNGNGDFTSIQAAINDNNVENGDSLKVMSGTYTENVNVTKSLVIFGTDSSTVVVSASNGNNSVFRINADLVELSHMTIKGSTNREGIYFSSTSVIGAAIIQNNIIKENDEGIDLVNVNGHVKILNNVIGNGSDNNDFAIKLIGRSGNTGKATISGNLINLGSIPSDEKYGIYVKYFPSITVANNTIDLIRSNAKLVYIRNADSLFIHGNSTSSDVYQSLFVQYIYDYISIKDNNLPGSDIGYQQSGNTSANILFDNNDFSGAHQKGLYIDKADSLTITNNHFEAAPGGSQSQHNVYIRFISNLSFTGNHLGPNNLNRCGLYARDGNSAVIDNNTQYGKASMGIYLKNLKQKVTVQNNSADSSKYGLYQSGNFAQTDYIINNNDFSDCTVYGISLYRGDTISIAANLVAAPTSGSQSGKSIYVKASKNLTVSGNTCGTNNRNREAIYVRSGKIANINNNIINPGSSIGIYIRDFTEDITIQGNRGAGSIQYGCRIYNSTRTSNITIHQNDFSESEKYGVYVYKADSVSITNTAAQAKTGGLQTERSIFVKDADSYVIIANDTVGTHSSSGGDYAIYVANTPIVIVKDNVIEGPNDKVIYISDSSSNPRLRRLEVLRNNATNFNYGLYNSVGLANRDIIVKQNLFADGTQHGIYISGGDSLICVNNTLTDCNRGLYFRNIKALIKNNIATNNNYGLYRSGSYSYTLVYNNVWSNSNGDYYGLNAGATDISVDPKYVDPTNNDYHLKSLFGSYHGGAWTLDTDHSSCIDAGDPIDAYSNEVTPNGDRINMGAYGNTAQASKSGSINTTLEYADFPRKKWVMWGVPLTPENGDPLEVVGDDFGSQPPNGSNWRVVRWVTADEGYAFYGEDGEGDNNLPGQEPPDFTPGYGFWVIQDVLQSVTVDVTGVKHTVSVPDTVIIEKPAAADKTGLNLLANPFQKVIDWSDTQVTDGTETKTILEAATAGWLNAHAYSWNHESEENEIISPNETSTADTISVWEGFWINQIDESKNLKLIFPYPTTQKTIAPQLPFVDLYGRSIPVDRTQIRDSFIDWVLDLQLITENGEYRDVNNRIGVSENSSEDFDGLDALYFESIDSAFGALYFPHDDWLPAVNLDYDYRHNEWEEQLWDFQIYDQNVSGVWYLRWPGISNVPGNVHLSITNPDTADVIIPDLRLESEYSISLVSGSKNDFILKAVAIEDTLAPYVQAGFVQNPLLDTYVDLYVFPNEPIEDLTIFVNDDIQIPEFNEGVFNIYRASFEIEEYGNYTIIFSSGDLAGNNGEDTLLVAFQGALAGRVMAPNGKVEINRFPNRLLDNRTLVGLGYGLEQSALLLPADIVGNIYTTFLPPLQSDENVEIIFNLFSFGLQPSQFSKVSLYQETSVGWKAIPAILNSQIGTLSAAITQSSRLALLRISGNTESAPLLPDATDLLASYPNPFNSSTVIPYTIANESQVKIVIYDLLGREVKVLMNKIQTPGRYTIIWSGKNQFGFQSASGIYFVRFEAGVIKRTKKLSLVR